MKSPPDDKHRTLVDLTLRNERFKRVVLLCIGPALNSVLAIFNGIVAISQGSPWAGTLSGYFAVLCFMGSYVAACSIKPKENSARTVLTVCGVSIIILAMAITFIKCQVVGNSTNETLHPFAMIALAAFTFATAVTTIINATKARHGDSYRQAFLRISVASMLGALMMLEQQMLGTFGEITDTSADTIIAIETASGAVVVLVLVAMGISLLAKARKA